MIELKYPLWKIAAIIAIIAVAPLGYVLANQLLTPFHGVGVLKSATPFAAVGETVTYQIKVYNPSGFDLYNINVTDNLLGFSYNIPFMAAGNETGVTYILDRIVLESDPSPLINTVYVEAKDSEGIYSTASTQAKTTIIKRLIGIEKIGPDFAHEGEAVKYTIMVTNLADSPLSKVIVQDEMMGFSWRGDLDVGEYNEFNLTYVVPKEAEDPLINKVTASAELGEWIIYVEETWTIDLLHPELEVKKTVEPREVRIGNNVTYTITVINTGDTDLFHLELVDAIYGSAPPEIVPSSLQPEESFTWTFNATIYECTVNKAWATGIDASGKKVCDYDKTKVEVYPKCCPGTIGYWKHYVEIWPCKEIELGDVKYTKEEALKILKGANSEDATRMLAAQLVAAKLNRLKGAPPCCCYREETLRIDNVISEADDFLVHHPVGSDPKGDYREAALWLKNILDAYNNRECD